MITIYVRLILSLVSHNLAAATVIWQIGNGGFSLQAPMGIASER
jgi:hypothetical protein